MYKSYFDYVSSLYSNVYPKQNVRDITFQVTEDCCCNCSYCYQTNKGNKYMSINVAKSCIDLLFKMYSKDEIYINKNTIGFILNFIGGEPLLNINIIDYICSYFLEKSIKENSLWALTWHGSMCSNGALYFNTEVQTVLEKFRNFLLCGITLDGPKEIHDRCRKYFDGRGNFDDAYAAFKYARKHFNVNDTKVTIAPENLKDINTIIDFFINEDISLIHANTIHEHFWTIQEGQIFYQELKKMADKLLLNPNVIVSLFYDRYFHPLMPTELQTWCGGTGRMLAFNTEGQAFPCIRYMNSSLNNEQPEIILGDCNNGIINTPETEKIYHDLCAITRRTQSTDECFNCSIASGCAYCSGWNYQFYGTANSRCTSICNMHKARSLANVYYWNNYYEQQNIPKVFEMYLSKDEALKFIDEKEYNMLLDLVNDRKKTLGYK